MEPKDEPAITLDDVERMLLLAHEQVCKAHEAAKSAASMVMYANSALTKYRIQEAERKRKDAE